MSVLYLTCHSIAAFQMALSSTSTFLLYIQTFKKAWVLQNLLETGHISAVTDAVDAARGS